VDIAVVDSAKYVKSLVHYEPMLLFCLLLSMRTQKKFSLFRQNPTALLVTYVLSLL
jgi:hypothetical protein